jgi:hypothetical protein
MRARIRIRLGAALLATLCLCAAGASATGRRMPLECFDLTALRYVEYRWPSAVVSSPDGAIHRVRKGDFVGLNVGRVVRITRDAISVVETVPDGDGGWMESPALMRRVEPGETVEVAPGWPVDHCKAQTETGDGRRD